MFKLINHKSAHFIPLLVIALIPISFSTKMVYKWKFQSLTILHTKVSGFYIIKRRKHTSEEDAGDPYWHHSCLG